MSKKFWTLVFRYDIDGEPCDPPPHIQDRIAMVSSILHEIGFGLDVIWGEAPASLSDMIDTGESK